MALTPLLSHATAGWHVVRKPNPAGRQAVREPGQPGPLNATASAHFHPGQARTVYRKSQLGGYFWWCCRSSWLRVRRRVRLVPPRARGLGTAWTSLHLAYEREAAAVLGIPYEQVMQVALIPAAHTIGTDFKPGPRIPADQRVHWDNW